MPEPGEVGPPAAAFAASFVFDHVETVRREAQRLAAVLERVPLDSPVPSCPGWSARDLLRHLGGVHRWATEIVASPRNEPLEVELEVLVGGWPPDEELLGWFATGADALVVALARAAPDLRCWTFLEAPTPLTMWRRRQAHETLVHRLDAELAAQVPPATVDSALAADGLDELLCALITRGRGPIRLETPRRLAVVCDDEDASWTLEFAERTTVVGGVDADCVVSGPADALHRTLWQRGGREIVTVRGDETLFEHFLERVHIRWS